MNVGMTKSIHLTVTFYELEKKRKTQRYRPFSLFENLFLAAGFGRLPPAGALIDGAETRLCLAGEEGAIKSANSLLLAPATRLLQLTLTPTTVLRQFRKEVLKIPSAGVQDQARHQSSAA